MIVLSGNDISVSFGGETLFHDVNFRLEENGRAGLVGVNGCGKTTLMHVINGRQEAETGGISKAAGIKIGCMEQYVIRDDNITLYDEVLEIFRPLIDAENELADIAVAIDTGDHSEQTLSRQMQLQERFEREGGLTYKSMTCSALVGLGFSEDDFNKPISVMSGGQKSKAQLAKLLLSGSNILLLDEPTNHLDITACEWLEKFLTEYKGAYIVISHDRYFLDKVTDTTFEMENRTLREYKGNYTRYLELKAEAREAQQRVYDRTVKEINRIEGIVEQQKRWGQEHNFITAASKQKQADRLKETLEKPEDLPEAIKFTFRAKEGGANDVLIAKGLSKSFDGTVVFTNAELDIKKNTTTFILGENGCGKTTLLKILTGEYQADSGEYKFANNIQFGYYDQAQTDLDPSKTVIDEVWDRYPKMTQTQVRSALAQFLFKGDDVFKNVGKLSGGEKARVSLLKLMLSKANMLLLDEPTNHLDIHSREALENALASYGGTLLIVSHDRYLINKLADRIVWLGKTGTVNIDGNYDRYIELKEAKAQSEQAVQVKPAEGKKNDYKERKERESTLRKLSGALKRCEQAIDEIGLKTAELAQQMSQPEIATDYEKTSALAQEIEALKEKEEALTAEWMELSEQIESFT
ncbi:ATPase components of ABC transporters with duplicated ATPase domains [[Eubacterium] siraeum 70/3]|jgi:ATP-binding cassette subfamily F protein 3|uniref:ATPase components of ABC transporters with duplicated ATPase domains n=1 Tax=[Eubacterium] siraeum 70/3 TaxID=657319 RepID=D4JWI0_9FIRM|nr:ATPase components of ABC transporters with duplicated ATPase domains [[Eubacterium] siraeum 70/3]